MNEIDGMGVEMFTVADVNNSFAPQVLARDFENAKDARAWVGSNLPGEIICEDQEPDGFVMMALAYRRVINLVSISPDSPV